MLVCLPFILERWLIYSWTIITLSEALFFERAVANNGGMERFDSIGYNLSDDLVLSIIEANRSDVPKGSTFLHLGMRQR